VRPAAEIEPEADSSTGSGSWKFRAATKKDERKTGRRQRNRDGAHIRCENEDRTPQIRGNIAQI
jgi:hypothetical protein